MKAIGKEKKPKALFVGRFNMQEALKGSLIDFFAIIVKEYICQAYSRWRVIYL